MKFSSYITGVSRTFLIKCIISVGLQVKGFGQSSKKLIYQAVLVTQSPSCDEDDIDQMKFVPGTADFLNDQVRSSYGHMRVQHKKE